MALRTTSSYCLTAFRHEEGRIKGDEEEDKEEEEEQEGGLEPDVVVVDTVVAVAGKTTFPSDIGPRR